MSTGIRPLRYQVIEEMLEVIEGAEQTRPDADLRLSNPEWAAAHEQPARYKGAKGGRSAGKSHVFAEHMVNACVEDPHMRGVCIREVQRSLKFSAKALIEKKIRQLGASSYFDVLNTEIRRRNGTGVIIFEGMQDHTAESIKSLEGFGRAWVEEAQNLSEKSLGMLEPTIRAPGSELWFSWNPGRPEDPVEEFFQRLAGDAYPTQSGTVAGESHGDAYVVTHSTYLDNPFNADEVYRMAERLKRADPEGYEHVWMGAYNKRSKAQVLADQYAVEDFEPQRHWDGPYYGIDWGFSNDPTVLVRFWLGDSRLWVEYCVGGIRWDNAETERRFDEVPGTREHVMRADSARPETINEMKQRGFNIVGAKKPKGSVEDGIQWLRSHDMIVIHPRCDLLIQEAKLWSYKTDRLTGDPLPKLEKGNDHGWDAVRYGAEPMILGGGVWFR